MNTIRALPLLFVPVASALPQTLISDHIPNYTYVNEPPGFVYADSRTFKSTYTFEIRFRIDPAKFSSDQKFNCSGVGGVAEGYILFDRYPENTDGRWIVAVGGNGQLCFMDQPRYSWGSITYSLQLPVEVGTCHTLTAVREANGILTVSLDNALSETADEYGGAEIATWRAGPNGVGVGREVNGYHSWRRWDSFPGEIYYVDDNGAVVEFENGGTVTGGAYLGNGYCDFGAAVSSPVELPLGPEPDLTACEIDPESVACACEVNPHPACHMCLIEEQ